MKKTMIFLILGLSFLCVYLTPFCQKGIWHQLIILSLFNLNIFLCGYHFANEKNKKNKKEETKIFHRGDDVYFEKGERIIFGKVEMAPHVIIGVHHPVTGILTTFFIKPERVFKMPFKSILKT